MGLKQENARLTQRLEQLWDSCKDMLNNHELQVTPTMGIQAANMSKQTTNHTMKQGMHNSSNMTTPTKDSITTQTRQFSTSSQMNRLLMTPNNPIMTSSSPIMKIKDSMTSLSYNTNLQDNTTCKGNMNLEANSSIHLVPSLPGDLHPNDSLNQYLSSRITKLNMDTMDNNNHDKLNLLGNKDINLSLSLLDDRDTNPPFNKKNCNSTMLKPLNILNFNPSSDSLEDKDHHSLNMTFLNKNVSHPVNKSFSPQQSHQANQSHHSMPTNLLDDKNLLPRVNNQTSSSLLNIPVEKNSLTLGNKDYSLSQNHQSTTPSNPDHPNLVHRHNQGQTPSLLPKKFSPNTDLRTQARSAQRIPHHRLVIHPNGSSLLNSLEPHVPSYPTLHTWRQCAVDVKPLTLEDLATDSDSYDSQSAQLFIFR